MRAAAFLLPVAIVAAAPLAAAEVVPVPAFQSLELLGGGEVVLRNGPSQRVTILSGSSQVTEFRVDRRGKLIISACRNRCPRRYDLKIEVQSPSVPAVAVRGGGEITAASGFAPQQQLAAAVDGGGEIDLRAVRVGDFSGAVNGGGKILAGPSTKLAATVNGGGEIRYSGNPVTAVAINGGGAVTRGD